MAAKEEHTFGMNQSGMNQGSDSPFLSQNHDSFAKDGSVSQGRSNSGYGQSASSQQQGYSSNNQPLSNLAFDWVTFVQNKAEAVNAYGKYIQDAEKANASDCADFFRKVQKADCEQLTEAKKHLAAVLQGKMGH